MNLPTSQFHQITMRVSLPQEQAELLHATMQQWMVKVPTVYFLDICSIGHIKTYLQKRKFKDTRHEASIQALQKLDIKHNAVSYLPALMEKASDQRSKFSAEKFIAEARRDWDAMSVFFNSAHVYVRIPTKLDSDSTGSWTRIPGQAGQSVRSDAGRSGFTRVMSLGSSCRASA